MLSAGNFAAWNGPQVTYWPVVLCTGECHMPQAEMSFLQAIGKVLLGIKFSVDNLTIEIDRCISTEAYVKQDCIDELIKMVWQGSAEPYPVLLIGAVVRYSLISSLWHLQCFLWNTLGKVQGRWTRKGHRVINRIKCYWKGPRSGFWIYVFICHAVKFRSKVRHVLIFPILHHYKSRLKGTSSPSCLWLLAVLITRFSGSAYGVFGSLEKRLGLAPCWSQP